MNQFSIPNQTSYPPNQIIERMLEAMELCNRWKSAYFTKRAEIEVKGRDARWEFDKKRLFTRTDYIQSICADVREVAGVLQAFNNIFGPELKSATREPKRIDDVSQRVQELLLPFKQVRFSFGLYSLNQVLIFHTGQKMNFFALPSHWSIF